MVGPEMDVGLLPLRWCVTPEDFLPNVYAADKTVAPFANFFGSVMLRLCR